MKNKRLIILAIIAAVALALGILIPLKAADKLRSHNDTAEFIEIIKIYKLTHELSLSAEQLKVFYPKYNELQELKRQYSIARREAKDEFRSLLAKEYAPEKEFEDSFNKHRNTENSIVQKMIELRDELESQLSFKQKIKLMLFDDSYRRDVKKILQTLKELDESKKKYSPSPVRGKG